jgi:hypothetical protein
MSTAELDVYGLHKEFQDTEHGQVLADQVRYERYKPDGVTNERWVEVLGADVNNLQHMPLTWGLAKDMIRGLRDSRPGYLDEHEELLIEVAAIIHDRGEAVVTDVTYSEKTDELEAAEQEVLTGMVDESHEIVKEAAHTVVFDRGGNKLSRIFNTIERVGYMRTALRAARHIQNGTAPDCEAGLRWIVADVFGNHPEVLLERAAEYPPVQQYLYGVMDEITAAFGVVRRGTFGNYDPSQKPDKIIAFYNNAATWERHIAQFGEYATPLILSND